MITLLLVYILRRVFVRVFFFFLFLPLAVSATNHCRRFSCPSIMADSLPKILIWTLGGQRMTSTSPTSTYYFHRFHHLTKDILHKDRPRNWRCFQRTKRFLFNNILTFCNIYFSETLHPRLLYLRYRPFPHRGGCLYNCMFLKN